MKLLLGDDSSNDNNPVLDPDNVLMSVAAMIRQLCSLQDSAMMLC